jgi:hypothetical protein
MTGLRWFPTRYPFRFGSPVLIMLAPSLRVSTTPLPQIGRAEHLYTGLGLPPWFLRYKEPVDFRYLPFLTSADDL